MDTLGAVTPPDAQPGHVTVVKLTPEQQQVLEQRIADHDRRRPPREYATSTVPTDALDHLAVGDMFIVRAHTPHLQRVRLQLQNIAKAKGWYLYMQIDPTAAPPSGFTDLYGYVQEQAAAS
jgi:hypothetical protein